MRFIMFILFVLLMGIVGFAQDEEQPVSTPNCAAAIKIDELTFTTIKDLREKLDSFGLQVKSSNALGIVIGYGGKETESNEGSNIASEAVQYLDARFGLPDYTITTRN